MHPKNFLAIIVLIVILNACSSSQDNAEDSGQSVTSLSTQANPREADETQIQQTVDASINQRFTQTAAVQSIIDRTQTIEVAIDNAQTATAEVHATNQAEYYQTQTSTAAFQATVDAGFQQAMTATQQAVLAGNREVINPNNIERIEILSQVPGGLNHISFSPDGSMIAGSDSGVIIRIYDYNEIDADPIELELDADSTYYDIEAFAFNGAMVAAYVNNGNVYLWDVGMSEELAVFRGEAAPLEQYWKNRGSIAFSPDGSLLATTSMNNPLHLWYTDTRELYTEFEDISYSLAFSPDGMLLAVVTLSSIKVWNLETLSSGPQEIIDFNMPIEMIVFSPDGRFLAILPTNSPISITIFDVATWRRVAILDAENRAVLTGSLAFSPDGALLAVGTRDDGEILIWDMATFNLLVALQATNPDNAINDVAFSPDGTTLVGSDYPVDLWGIPLGN